MEQNCITCFSNRTESLEAKIEALKLRYNLQKLDYNFAELQIEIYKVKNIDELLDRINEPEEIPFWAELWPAARGLAQFILQRRELLDQRTVLELGTGVGLAGIVAKLAGADLVHTDFAPDALEFVKLNYHLNQITDGKLLLADWKTFPTNLAQFDYLIGSDILYEKLLHDHLIEIFQSSLKPGGAIWLADPGRDYAKLFIDKITKYNWQISKEQLTVAEGSHDILIDIYQLTRINT